MDDIARICTKIAVLNKGKLAMYGTPREIFAHPDELSQMGLGVPQAALLSHELRKRGKDIPLCLTIEELAGHVIRGTKC